MNENVDLTKILKNCPKGWELYSPIYGEVKFRNIIQDYYPIVVELSNTLYESFMANGKINPKYDGECVLLPSKDQRDWSKFTAPWYKKNKNGKFNPKTLKLFSIILARLSGTGIWYCDFFSFIEKDGVNLIKGCGAYYRHCIPYNDETKHLAGATDEAPEYYRYWED